MRPLLAAAAEHDGIAAFSEAFELGLDDARAGHTHLTVEDSGGKGAVIACAALAPDGSCELVVDPRRRREGLGTALAEAVRRRDGGAGFWAHGDLPAARALAAELGLTAQRELLVMGVDAAELGELPAIPDGFEALSYPEAARRFGRERVEEQWLEVNNEAFSWHPEQGGWDLDRLHRGMEAEWFDPDGVRLLYDGATLAGFHWTKRHPDGTGEVYVVGLASRYRGEGMGGPLMRVGLEYLIGVGSPQVILYVEADNEPAVKRYRQLGFAVRERHVVYK